MSDPSGTRLDEACFLNPLGRGWIEERYFQALGQADQPRPAVLPAPQFEYPNQPIESLAITRHPDASLDAARMAEVARQYPYTPAGLGAMGRAWTPRLQLAGAYDTRWEDHRWPFLPKDFDFGYWNCAPPDQQLPYPPPDLAVELCHLCPPAQSHYGRLGACLPGHRAFVLARFDTGVILPLPMVIDTLILDTDAMQIAVVWRAAVRRDLPLRVLEARIETDPDAPLLKLPPRHHTPTLKVVHG